MKRKIKVIFLTGDVVLYVKILKILKKKQQLELISEFSKLARSHNQHTMINYVSTQLPTTLRKMVEIGGDC